MKLYEVQSAYSELPESWIAEISEGRKIITRALLWNMQSENPALEISNVMVRKQVLRTL